MSVSPNSLMSLTVPDEVTQNLSRWTPMVREAMELTGGAARRADARPAAAAVTEVPTDAELTTDSHSTSRKTSPSFGLGGTVVESMVPERLITGKRMGLEESLLIIRSGADCLGTGSGDERTPPALAECERNDGERSGY